MQRRWHRRDGGPRDRGATLVEAAFVFPVLVLLTFGMIEFGLLFKDYLTVADMTRAGARVGSADGNSATADYDILQALISSGEALQHGSLRYVVIYKANESGSLPTGCDTASQIGVCNRYTPADLTSENLTQDKFGGCTGDGIGGTGQPDRSWCPTTRKNTTSGGTPPDNVGVYVSATHPYFTGFFGTSRTLSDATVMRIEPVQ